MIEAKTIERIAEELGVNSYDLEPLLRARDKFYYKQGIQLVVEWIKEHSSAQASYTDDDYITRSWLEISNGLWFAQVKEWLKND